MEATMERKDIPTLNRKGTDEMQRIFEEVSVLLKKSGVIRVPTSLHDVTIWEVADTPPNSFDLILQCHRRTHVVHRDVVLDLSSDFTKKVQEISPRWHFLALPTVAGVVMNVLLSYAYKKQDFLFDKLPFSTLFYVMKVAESMKMIELQRCLQRTFSKMDETTFITALWDFSARKKSGECVNGIIDYLIDHSEALFKKCFFSRIHWQRLHAILTKANKDKLGSSDTLLRASVQWLHVDEQGRKDYIPEIERLINWKEVSRTCVRRLATTDSMFRMQFSQALVDNNFRLPAAKKVLSTVSLRKEFRRKLFRRAASSQVNKQQPLTKLANSKSFFPTFIIFAEKDTNSISVHACMFHSKTWDHPFDLFLIGRFNHSPVLINGRLYIIGGNDNTSIGTNKCSIYNFHNKRHYPFSDLNEGRLGAGVVVHNNSIYVFGGMDRTFGNRHCLTSVERIFLQSPCSKWEVLSPLSYKRAFPGMVTTKDYVYVIGGYTTSCERYDIARNSWSTMLSLPRRFRSCAMHAVKYGNKILAFRRNGNSEVCTLDLKTNSLCVLPACGQVPNDIIGCGVVGQEMWAMGRDGKLYIYNIARYIWKTTDIKYHGATVFHACFFHQRELKGLLKLQEAGNSVEIKQN